MNLTNISKRVAQLSTKKNIIIASLASIAFLVPYTTVVFGKLLAKGPLLDQQGYFTAADLHNTLTNYGPQLRSQYLVGEYVDLLVAGVLLTVAMLISASFLGRNWNTKWNIVPLIAAALNTIKGILLITLIGSYPHESATLVSVASSINILKTIALFGSIALLLIAIISLIATRQSKKVNQ